MNRLLTIVAMLDCLVCRGSGRSLWPGFGLCLVCLGWGKVKWEGEDIEEPRGYISFTEPVAYHPFVVLTNPKYGYWSDFS